ncbi:uncharacterized protein LOC111078020 [Drosophila obscura]|uniref:uncharacterized protein LOC111078020 n=1 Tax=Drosophila obscura TaxID=7282 RepID=UPI000BA1815B|nr:uncharacterized protein LOC111078020 [Drosophila obscura]
MEADLAFLINALSMPDTPLTRPHSEEQLQEIRESFISLQRLLRHNALPVNESSLCMPRSKAGGNLPREQCTVSPALRALEESPVRGQDSSSFLSCRDRESSDEERKQTVSQIIRGSDTFSFWSLNEDTYETRTALVGDGSSDVIVTRRKTHSSKISMSAPVELVWSNSGYISQSTDSDTTIKPDGHRFILRK